jgi:chitinase
MTRRERKQALAQGLPYRKLSLWRLSLALLVVAGLSFGGFISTQRYIQAQAANSTKPWFAPYVDVTATPAYSFEQTGLTGQDQVVLSFIVSLPTQACTPSWGAAYSIDQARDSLDLDRRIARLRDGGGRVAVSFGGLKNNELAVGCQSPDDLYNAYKQVVDHYQLDTIDLDLENQGLTDQPAALRRAQALARLQTERRHQGKHLAIWLTLPVSPQGLTPADTTAIGELLKNKVDLAGVNLMTMDYGDSLPKGDSMLTGSISALTEAHRQLGVLYQRAGTYLSDNSLWHKLGATPMLGQNDSPHQIFTLDDAEGLNSFARKHGISRMSMWSANRDLQCGSNYATLTVVSDSCSGVIQDKYAFALTLGSGFVGNLSLSSGRVTTADQLSKLAKQPDNPSTSPYQIWSDSGSYLQGTKVVWHHSVYQAKWWTSGDVPDNPVLQSWQTPWQLIGPVLPGEKPIKQATLPAGTYPMWSGKNTYDKGDRVLFDGTPFQAKWWNQGESPAAAASNPDGSPWVPLTQAQINQILADK